MKYDLLILDLDGTTVESRGDALPSRAVINAVHKAQAQGVCVAIATGRVLNAAKPVAEALGLTGPSIFNGGAEIVDLGSGKVLSECHLSVDKAQEVARLALPFGVKLFDDSHQDLGQYDNPIKRPEDILRSTKKLFIDSVPATQAALIAEKISGLKGVQAHLTTSWTPGDVFDIHVTDALADKRHGVEKLIQILNLSKEQVIAIGDGYNDLPMLEAVGLKAVMGDAPEPLKSIADYVAPSLANDGVADVIKRFIITQ